VLASTALLGLLGLPIILGLFIRIAAKFADYRPWVKRATLTFSIVGAIVVLGAAWAWRLGGAADAVVGGWSIVSFLGTPLVVGTALAGGCAVIALAAVRVAQLISQNQAVRMESASSHGLLMVGAALAMLGHTTPTLLIGLGLMNIAGLWHALRRTEGNTAVRAFGAQLIAVLIAAPVFILGSNASADYRLTAAAPAADTLLALLLNAAAALHANLLPFGSTRNSTTSPQASAGLLGAAALLTHASAVEPWLPALAAVSAVFWSVRALGSRDISARFTYLRDAAAAFSLAIGTHAPAAAAAGWLLGTALLQLSGVAGIVGVFALLALPGSIGFAAAGTTQTTDSLDIGLTILRSGAAAVMGFALLRHALEPSAGSSLRSSLRDSMRMRQLPPLTIIGAHLIVLSIAPSLAGLPPLVAVFAAAPPLLWASTLLSLLVAAALWRLAGDADMTPINALTIRTSGVMRPFFAALDRIAASVGTLLLLLESDGALLIACLVLIIGVLTIGQATP
jgi:hypothetical protein